MKQAITSSPILLYPDPDRQYYLFTASSQHSLSGFLTQYHKQVKEDGTKINVPHPITDQRSTFNGSQKNCSELIKEAYVI